MRVLLVEDEKPMAAVLRNGLVRHGMVVDNVENLADADTALYDDVYDAVVLDRRLPDGDGLSLVKSLRARGDIVPVLVLTAKGDLLDRIAGLDSGADDYLGKPFAFDELLARLRAILRRPTQLQPDIVRLGRMSFDFAHLEAHVEDVRLRMPRRELLVLEALMRRMGRMVLRETLMEAVFGMNDEIESNALDTHISRLRRKLTDAHAGVAISGIRGVGYLLSETT
ncbi:MULTISPECIES: response regulator transcription factor [Rhizobium]|uniref:DNA-binding response regulator, OmpR family, contains REC and winged-helix (WHTH) domain n=1 Tax=Rhizobium miluonense TaxID=411945 RepID=A0A1C3WHH2_9HYPH|nr:response regulator transcription factor [Rhizobium miluonense]SCB39517.1 DNA-binding response regulator, OmpR family, contains REC and winged-helix (wHTH) domain [Rhizobium miluonense]